MLSVSQTGLIDNIEAVIQEYKLARGLLVRASIFDWVEGAGPGSLAIITLANSAKISKRMLVSKSQ